MEHKGFLNDEQRMEIARYKSANPDLSYKLIAKDFNITERQVFDSVHRFPELSGVSKKDIADNELLKKIAIWKANHPEYTLERLGKKFKVPSYVARYALKKFAELSETMKNTKKGRFICSKYIADAIDEIETLKSQLNFCLAELENNNKLVISSRVDLLYKVMRIRVHLQHIEIESYLKRIDASIIAAIIRRFIPSATNDEIIKIYKEESAKLNAEN